MPDHATGPDGRNGQTSDVSSTEHSDETAIRAELTAALRREAEDVVPGSVPLDTVLRKGRARRRHQRATVVCAVLAAVAVPVSVAFWPQQAVDAPRYAAPPADSSPRVSPTPTAGTLTVLEPYEAVAVAPGWKLGLLPEGRQSYVLTESDNFDADMEYRRGEHLGDSIRPDSISGGSVSGDTPHVSGSWRLAQPPQRITLTTEAGREFSADLFTLSGNPGWGVYNFHDTGVRPYDTFTLTAYDAQGEVFDTHEHTPWFTTAPPGEGS